MSTITEVVPGLGSPPLTTDPTTFDPRADTLYGTSLPALIASLNTFGGQANALAAAMNSVAAGAATSIPYTFSTTTADADPGNGFLRLDNATQNIAATIRADLVGSDASTWTSLLDIFDDSTSTIKGFIMLMKSGDATKWLLFSVSALASPAGYKNITVANVASSAASPFTDGDSLILKFTRNGDKGDTGPAGGITIGTPVATTSGTSIDFTGIPAGTKRITVMFANVSSNGISNFLIQIGDSGGIEATAYNSVASVGGAAAGSTSTTGFYITHQNSAAYLYSGSVVLTLENASAFTWTAFGGVGVANTGSATVSQGSKSLSAMLDRVRLTTVSGADTFDAGEINISYE